MLKFNIITIFPEIFKGFVEESLIKKAQEKGLISIATNNLRDFTEDKHKVVDDKPYGGGFGMVMMVEPIYKAISKIKKSGKKSKVVLFTPRGKKFTQKIANDFSKLDQLVFICGRYEAVDERVAKNIADIELSIGDYVLMGGEVPAMAVIETVTRLIPGAIGKEGLLDERITKTKGFIEREQYTRPEVFSPKKGVNWKVPGVLLSGNHDKINQWKEKHSKVIER